ncbi:MAG: nodulation protein NfeD [Ammonifex sp.]|nr:MAG: nodulation protein NfeD [Ammonifex sp.]
MRRISALLLLIYFIAVFGLVLTAAAGKYDTAASAAPAESTYLERVVVLEVDGPIIPVVERYLERGIEKAERQGAVCLIKLNTPGGLYNVTQKIVTRIVNARTPVIVYVSPAGGWAASAGAFISLGAHAVAMAPGTRIGAAHPVAVGEDKQDVPMEKVTSDAAAWMRSLAELRGRNVEMAEAMVTDSRSFSADEAVKLKLVDFVAADETELCSKLSGKKMTLGDGRSVVLKLSQSRFEELKPNRVERFLGALLNPDIAYLLLTIGMAGLMVEIYHPGLVIPGVVGGISLLLGLYSMGTLDAYWGGLILILLAFGCFVGEAFAPTHGILGTGGVIAFIFGSLLLFSMQQTGLGISIGLIAAVSVTLAGLMALLVVAVIRGQKRRVLTGMEGLIGYDGVARTDLDPEGTVLVAGEIWRAVAAEGKIERGEKVKVVQTEGISLKVSKKG